MSLSFRVVKSELAVSARALERQLESFRASTEQTRNAADELGNMWEGDARNAFVAEQDHNLELYRQMERAVADFIAAMKEAEVRYSETDSTCARILRSR